MFKYDMLKIPPAPFLEVRLINPALSISYTYRGKIDTGADLTVVPTHIVYELKLQPRGSVRIRGYRHDEPLRRLPLYYVDVELAGYRFRSIKAISTYRPDILIGRNVLNETKLVLNGKNLRFEVSEP